MSIPLPENPEAPMPACPPSKCAPLAGRIEPKEKAEARFPSSAIAMLLRIAAEAPAAEMDFQSVEMVDIRLSTASLHRLRSSLPLARDILMYAALTRARTRRIGIKTAAATFPLERVGLAGKLLTCSMAPPTDVSWTAPEVVFDHVPWKMGPAGIVARKGGVPDGMMANWRLTDAVEFHHCGCKEVS